MIRKYDLLKNVLIDIEEGIRKGVNTDTIANKMEISSVHLQRLFKYTFNQTIGAYIRSRKLAASIESLFNTKNKLIDIAIDHGYKYEQSYIQSFKRKFGVTPGNVRKTNQVLNTTPTLNLLSANINE